MVMIFPLLICNETENNNLSRENNNKNNKAKEIFIANIW